MKRRVVATPIPLFVEDHVEAARFSTDPNAYLAALRRVLDTTCPVCGEPTHEWKLSSDPPGTGAMDCEHCRAITMWRDGSIFRQYWGNRARRERDWVRWQPSGNEVPAGDVEDWTVSWERAND